MTDTRMGRDELGRLEVSLADDGRVVEVRVLDADHLRTVDSLQESLSQALAIAELDLVGETLRATGRDAQYAGGPAPVAEPVHIPRVPRPGPDHRPVSRAELEVLAAGPEGGRGERVGHSGNGYLRLHAGPVGRGCRVVADEAWLSATTAGRLGAALREAFHDLT